MVMSSLSRLKKYFDLPTYQANHQAADLPDIPVHYFRPPLFSAPYRNALKPGSFFLDFAIKIPKVQSFSRAFFRFWTKYAR